MATDKRATYRAVVNLILPAINFVANFHRGDLFDKFERRVIQLYRSIKEENKLGAEDDLEPPTLGPNEELGQESARIFAEFEEWLRALGYSSESKRAGAPSSDSESHAPH